MTVSVKMMKENYEKHVPRLCNVIVLQYFHLPRKEQSQTPHQVWHYNVLGCY